MSAPVPKPAGLSVFFPAYNDSGTIASMVIRAVKAASELTPDYEVIVVNDGSVDATAQIADELARTYSHVRVIHHGNNLASARALQGGFRAARTEMISTCSRMGKSGVGGMRLWFALVVRQRHRRAVTPLIHTSHPRP